MHLTPDVGDLSSGISLVGNAVYGRMRGQSNAEEDEELSTFTRAYPETSGRAETRGMESDNRSMKELAVASAWSTVVSTER